MQDWHFWAIAALGLLISEMFSGDFWLTCLAVGCLAAAAVGLLPIVGLPLQILAFAGGTLFSLLALRPALRRHLHIGQDVVKTNMDALPGKSGVVTQRIGSGHAGRALVEGEDWRVVAIDNGEIEPGARVMVVQVDGSTLVVEKEA